MYYSIIFSLNPKNPCDLLHSFKKISPSDERILSTSKSFRKEDEIVLANLANPAFGGFNRAELNAAQRIVQLL